jgi:hypothetical protein
VPERFVAYYDELRIGDAGATYKDMAPRGDRPLRIPPVEKDD